MYIYIYIYIHMYVRRGREREREREREIYIYAYTSLSLWEKVAVRPVHLLRISLLRVLESNFPGDSLSNYILMIIPAS